MFFILKNVRKPFGERDKSAFSQGGLFLIQSLSETIFHSVEKGVWAFPNRDKDAILSLAIPSSSSFESRLSLRTRDNPHPIS